MGLGAIIDIGAKTPHLASMALRSVMAFTSLKLLHISTWLRHLGSASISLSRPVSRDDSEQISDCTLRASSSRLQLYAFSDKFWIHSKKLARGLPEPCRFPADLMRLAWPRCHFPNLLSVPLAGDSEKSLRRSCWLLVIPCAAWLHAVLVLSNIRSALCGRRPPVGFTLRASPSRLQLLRLYGKFWMRVSAVKAKYQSAVLNSGLVTFIAACHYIRVFYSWVNAYSYAGRVGQAPVLTSCIGRYAQIFCCICRIYLNSFLLLLMCCQHSTHRSCLPML